MFPIVDLSFSVSIGRRNEKPASPLASVVSILDILFGVDELEGPVTLKETKMFGWDALP